jgi:HEPN domain-containing protein
MQFRAEDYYHAALERMRQAVGLYREGKSWALAMYCGGLAVECLLRAYRWTEDATFEGRHDLNELLKNSGLLRIDDEAMRKKRASEEEIRDSGIKIRSAMNEVVIFWHNNLRFASEARLKAHLRQIGKLQRGKGDPLKKSAMDLLDAAQAIMDRGVALWTLKAKSSRR